MQEQPNRVRELREAADLTQAELAHRAGVTVGTVSVIERGETVPKVTTATAIARVLQVPVEALFFPTVSNDEVETPQGSAAPPAPSSPSVAFMPGDRTGSEADSAKDSDAEPEAV